MNIRAIVFDLYGTLVDVHSVRARCEALFPGQGAPLSMLWRQKQLEYTWLRSLMGDFADFDQVTRDALVFACRQLQLTLDAQGEQALREAYLRLTPFAEVPAALAALKARGLPLAVLSNGSARSIDDVVRHAGLGGHFAHLLSVDPVRIFKPHPSVYQLAVDALGVDRSSILFVSSNAWDASGARHFGFVAAWLARGAGHVDELGQKPDRIVAALDDLLPWLDALRSP